VVLALVQALGDPNQSVGELAHQALAKIGMGSVPSLIETPKTQDEGL
jgi:hypothetical protein